MRKEARDAPPAMPAAVNRTQEGGEGRFVVMLCTDARGGMSSVVRNYRRDGLFDRYPVRLLVTHEEGGAGRRVWRAAGAFAALFWWLLQGRVAAVHSHMAMRGSFWRKSLFNALARAFGVRVIAHLHGSEFRQFVASQPPWRQRLIRRQLEACACVIVLSASWAQLVREIAPAASVVEVPNHVDLPVLADARPAGGHEPVVLFLGLVGDRKGVFDLLPAFAQALGESPAMRLVVAGNGEVARAGRMAQELGIGGRVQFPGWVEGAAKESLLVSADIYVLPSHNENFPVSVLEAMARSLPVITTRVGGIPELVRDGVDGILVEPGDVAALAAALVALASDAGLQRRLGASGRSRIEAAYCPDVVLPRLYGVYDAVLAGRAPAAERSGQRAT